MTDTGRGKQSFREFTKQSNQLKRYTLSALKSGEQYTEEEIEEWYEQLIEQYRDFIQSDDIPNGDLWISRAENLAAQHTNEIATRYPNIRASVNSDDENDSGGDSEPDEPTDEQDSVLGIPIISADECVNQGNSARGQIIITYEELIEYLAPIPPSVIQGLIPVFREGLLIGYRLCAAQNT